MQGIDILLHTASPFPMTQPRNENDLIKPAAQGTLRAFRAAHAAGIKRVVLTSSFAAIMESELQPGKAAYDEENWSDPDRATFRPITNPKPLQNARHGILCATMRPTWR